MNEPCNKCNKCNDDKYDDDDDNKENCNNIHNPFDFNTIYDQNCYMNTSTHDDDNDECPALDLIVNHYADFVPAVPVPVPVPNEDNDNNDDDDNDDAYDDDMFELIQIDSN